MAEYVKEEYGKLNDRIWDLAYDKAIEEKAETNLDFFCTYRDLLEAEENLPKASYSAGFELGLEDTQKTGLGVVSLSHAHPHHVGEKIVEGARKRAKRC